MQLNLNPTPSRWEGRDRLIVFPPAGKSQLTPNPGLNTKTKQIIRNNSLCSVSFPGYKWYINCKRNLMSDKQERYARLTSRFANVSEAARRALPLGVLYLLSEL
jgi:hypothetical protein